MTIKLSIGLVIVTSNWNSKPKFKFNMPKNEIEMCISDLYYLQLTNQIAVFHLLFVVCILYVCIDCNLGVVGMLNGW